MFTLCQTVSFLYMFVCVIHSVLLNVKIKIYYDIITEGDKKAYYENSEWTVKQNKELIAKLRKETKELHKMKADRLAVILQKLCDKL